MDGMLTARTDRFRAFLRLVIVIAFTLAAYQIDSHIAAQSPPKGAAATPAADHRKEDPKCSFLRQELPRLQNSGAAVPERVPAGIRSVYGRFAAEANVNVLQGKINSCDQKEKLSSLARLRVLESMRLQHVDKIRKELPGSSADAVVEALNGLYEQEARSFYNYETVKIPMLDRDVIKDFPTLLDLVKRSSLPEEVKTSFTQNFRFIKYEEAGRLQNGLRGIDKDLGTTFAYVLRSDLGDRAAADVEQRKADEQARLEQIKASDKAQADSVERQKLNARITLSICALVVLALIGWILTGRDVVTWRVWLNVLAVAGVVLLGWILIGMGLLTWITEYVGLAF